MGDLSLELVVGNDIKVSAENIIDANGRIAYFRNEHLPRSPGQFMMFTDI